jgi:hypothetical protein
MHTSRKWWLLPAVLIAVHSGLILLLTVSIASSPDSEASMGWILPYYIDFPASYLGEVCGINSNWQVPIFFLALGILYWGLIGIAIQAGWARLVRRYQAKHGRAIV